MTQVKPSRVIAEENVEGSARHLVLPHEQVSKLFTTTPSVADKTRFLANDNGTITNFLHGASGQIIWILGDGLASVDHNTKIKRASGGVGVLDADKVYTFMCVSDPVNGLVWYETA